MTAGKPGRLVELPRNRVRLVGGGEPPGGEGQLIYVVLAEPGGGPDQRLFEGRVDWAVIVDGAAGRVCNLVLAEQRPSAAAPSPTVQLFWEPIAADDFLLKDQQGRVYARVERMTENRWWGSCNVMSETEPPHFFGSDAFARAKAYCLGMTRVWLQITELAGMPEHDPGGYEIAKRADK